ncbi:MAG: hypothetical protein ACXW6T_10315 [Candidatus Binatia bacterium]
MLPPTGISESDRRLLMRMQGKIDATLGTADNLMPLATRGRKSNVLPREETSQNDIEALSSSYPHLKGRRAGEYLDISLRRLALLEDR